MKTKSDLIVEINSLIPMVGDRLRSDEGGDAERDFVVARCPRRLEAPIRSLPTLSLHLLAVIADGPVSLVGLAARAGQLKGTASKHVQRLVEAGLVRREPIPGNRKEIELRTTADGELVNDAHSRLHEEMDRGWHDFLRRYTAEDLIVVRMVLTDLAAAHRDGVRLVAAPRER